MRRREAGRRGRWLAGLAACLIPLSLAGCGGVSRRDSILARCVDSWNRAPGLQRQELAIVVAGGAADGAFVTLRAPRGEAGELAEPGAAGVKPGRCVVGVEANAIFVLSGGGWRMVNATDSSDPALNVVYAAEDHPNADADGQGHLTLH